MLPAIPPLIVLTVATIRHAIPPRLAVVLPIVVVILGGWWLRTAYDRHAFDLRDWEQHRSIPDAPARALLLAIERDPEVMRRLLAGKAA